MSKKKKAPKNVFEELGEKECQNCGKKFVGFEGCCIHCYRAREVRKGETYA